jgi:hypothetical protein
MQLRNARLCLDCEELHEEQHCPVCASESFAFLAKWIPVDERRVSARPRRPPRVPESETSRPRKGWGLAGGLAGLALVAATSRWFIGRPPNGPADPGREEPPAS